MNTSIEKSEEERKKCTCSLKGGGQGGGQALVGEGRMAAGQGPAAAAGGKAGPPLAPAPGTGGLRGRQGRAAGGLGTGALRRRRDWWPAQRPSNACGATQPCHVSCLAAGVPAWQLGRAKAYGATLQEVTPRNLARPKELVFENLNLHGLLLKY